MMPELALLVGKKRSEFSSVQTDRAKERLFESSVQEQQKTLPLDHVVKNGCRGSGGIWSVAWNERGANIPASVQCAPSVASCRPWVYTGREERETGRVQ